MKKRITALFLCTVMACTVLAGCGTKDKEKNVEAPSLEGVYASNVKMAEEFLDGKTSIKMTLKAAIKGESSMLSSMMESNEPNINASVKFVADMDQDTIHMDADVDYNLFGAKDKASIEAYVEKNGNTYATEDGELWIKGEGEGFDLGSFDMEDLKDDEDVKTMISDLQKELDEEKDDLTFELEDDEWVLTYKADASEVKNSEAYDILKEDASVATALESLGLNLEDLLDLKGNIVTTVKFDKDSQYLTYMGVECSKEFLSSMADAMDVYVDSFDKLEFSLALDYNDKNVEVPSDVKKNAVEGSDDENEGGIIGGLGGEDEGGIIGGLGGDDEDGSVSAGGDKTSTVKMSDGNVTVNGLDTWNMDGDGDYYFTDGNEVVSVFYDDSYIEVADYGTKEAVEGFLTDVCETPVTLTETKIDDMTVFYGKEDTRFIILIDMGYEDYFEVAVYDDRVTELSLEDVKTYIGVIAK